MSELQGCRLKQYHKMASKEAATSSRSEEIERSVFQAMQTISEIQELLSCNSCLRFMEKPKVLWNCDHAFCEFCIIRRDACPLCHAPSWAEDKLEIAVFTNIAKLSMEMKSLFQEYRPNVNSMDTVIDKDDGIEEDQNEQCAGVLNLDNLAKIDEAHPKETLPSNSPADVIVADQSSGTDNDVEHVEEKLREILMEDGKILAVGVISPIEELQVDEAVDHVISDPLISHDHNKIQTSGAESDTPASSELDCEKPAENEVPDITESEMETQLDDMAAEDNGLPKAESSIRHSQELLDKVAADVLDASLRVIHGQEHAYVNDSSDTDAFTVEAHELMPLNIDHNKPSTDNETSASLVIENTAPKTRKRKPNSTLLCSTGTCTTPNANNNICHPSISVSSKSARACTRKRPIATATRRAKNPKTTFKFKVMPCGTFPDILEDLEESQVGPTSPLFQLPQVLRLNIGNNMEYNMLKPTKPSIGPILETETPSTPLLASKMPSVVIHKAPVTPKNMVTAKIGRSPTVRTPKGGKKNRKGETPLHIAAIMGDASKVRSLIAQSVPLNDKDNAGWTPLHEACHHGHADVVEQLLSAGAQINIPGYDNETPLMDAARQGHLNIVKLLLSLGADINLRSCYGLTALDVTTSDSVKEAIEEHQVLTQAINGSLNSQSFSTTVPDNIALSHSSSLKLTDIKQGAAILNAIINPKDLSLVTHHITPVYGDRRSPRTFKYLQSVAKGLWIVSNDWLESCANSGFWVREQPYELLGSKEDLIEGGPRRSRINKAAQYPSIFHGCHFYLYGIFKSPGLSKQHAGELIKLADGTMLTREPKPDSDSVQSCIKVPYHARKDSPQYFYTYYVVYDSKSGKPVRCVRRGKVCPVPLSWVLDCVSQFYMCEIPD